MVRKPASAAAPPSSARSRSRISAGHLPSSGSGSGSGANDAGSGNRRGSSAGGDRDADRLRLDAAAMPSAARQVPETRRRCRLLRDRLGRFRRLGLCAVVVGDNPPNGGKNFLHRGLLTLGRLHHLPHPRSDRPTSESLADARSHAAKRISREKPDVGIGRLLWHAHVRPQTSSCGRRSFAEIRLDCALERNVACTNRIVGMSSGRRECARRPMHRGLDDSGSSDRRSEP